MDGIKMKQSDLYPVGTQVTVWPLGKPGVIKSLWEPLSNGDAVPYPYEVLVDGDAEPHLFGHGELGELNKEIEALAEQIAASIDWTPTCLPSKERVTIVEQVIRSLGRDS